MTNQTPTQKAQSLGWTQCDYPHKAAKDMWYHPDASICDEGRYVSEEEMLEFIEAENNTTKSTTPAIDYLLDKYQGLVLPRNYHIASDDQDQFRWMLETLEESLNHAENNLKTAWEAGFALCASYGDNKHHFCGEQKENNWKKFLETLNND